jgi:lipid A 3-O-deacylase
MKWHLIIFSVLCFHLTPRAQKINIPQFLKISEDNDFFNLRGEGTDRGYSSGLRLELYYTKTRKASFPSSLLVITNNEADNLYGFGLSQNLFTPSNISASNIQFGERPYAGTLLISNMLISSDNLKKQRITTSISTGLIGKYAFGENIQSWFHGAIGYKKPKGWSNQIQTDVLLNYYINYEKLVFSAANNLEIIGNISGNAGTLSNNAGVGLQFRAGRFNDYFSNHEKLNSKIPAYDSKKISFYFYMKTEVVAVMDNSLLQGGFFSHDKSPYTISKDSITRAFLQYEYGIVMSKSRVGIAFYERLRTPEFKNTYTEQIGNITFYIGL